MKKRLLAFIFIFILFLVSSVSVGYSAFSTNLSISGDAFIRHLVICQEEKEKF